MTNKFKKSIFGLLLFAGSMTYGIANAQSISQPSEVPVEDTNGVDMSTGRVNLPDLNVKIGTSSSGLSRTGSFGADDQKNYIYFSLYGSPSSSDSLYVLNASFKGGVYRFIYGHPNLASQGYENQITVGVGATVRQMNGLATMSCSSAPIKQASSGYYFNSGACILTLGDGSKITYDNALASSPSLGGVVTSILRPDGEKINYNYDGTYVRSVNSSLGWMIKYEYDANHSISSIHTLNTATNYCDPNALSCSYDPNSQNSSKVVNGSVSAVYNNGQLRATNTLNVNSTVVTLPSGRATTYNFDSSGRVSSVNKSGKTWNYTYSTNVNSDFITTITSPDARTYKLATSPQKMLQYVVDEAGGTTYYSYNPSDNYNLLQVTFQDGGYQSYSYNSDMNVTSIANASIGGSVSATTTATYETCNVANYKYCHKPITVTNDKGIVTTYTYDANHGGIITETSPAINGIRSQTRYGYSQIIPYIKNAAGSLVAQPPVWRLTSISRCMTQDFNTCTGTADEAKTIINYSATNVLPTSYTVMRGDNTLAQTTTFTYDNLGQVIAIDGPIPNANDKTFTFYDLWGREVGHIGIDPDGSGNTMRYADKIVYDADGNTTEGIKGVTNGTDLNALNSLVPVSKVSAQYDTNTGLPIINRIYTYENGAYVLKNLFQTSYDNSFRVDCVAERTNPNTFSALPNSACVLGTQGTDGSDIITKYNYDTSDNIISRISAYGTSNQVTDFTKTFDAATGNLSVIADAKGNKTSYSYDSSNRLTKTCYPIAGNGTTSSTTDCVQFTYSGTYLASVKLRDGQTINYGYDGLSRLTTLSGAVAEGFSYNNFGLVTSHTKNGHYSNYSYNSLGWLLSETNDSAGSINISYGYDTYGRRTSLTYPDGFVLGYNYNDASELVGVNEYNTTPILNYYFDSYDNKYGFGRQNNLNTTRSFDTLFRIHSIEHGTVNTTTFDYGITNQIKTRTNSNSNFDYAPSSVNNSYAINGLNQIATKNGSAFAYDTRGNLTSDGVSSYAYNAENMLISATQAGATASLTYDAENRLQSITKSGVTTKFVYDGNDLIAEYNGSNQLLRKYVHGEGIDEPVVWYEGTGTVNKKFLYSDNQGSIIATADGSGNTVNISTYDAYGNRTNSNPSAASRFGYTGQVDLSELGLLYYKARMYDPKIGRFLQTDPIGYGAGMNWYAYVGGDPINMVDPSGMEDVPEVFVEVHGKRKCKGTCVGNLTIQPSINYNPQYAGTGGGGQVVVVRGKRNPFKNKCEWSDQGSIDEGERKVFYGGRELKITPFTVGLHPLGQGYQVNVSTENPYFNYEGQLVDVPNLSTRVNTITSAASLYANRPIIVTAGQLSKSGVYKWTVVRPSYFGIFAAPDASDGVDLSLSTRDSKKCSIK